MSPTAFSATCAMRLIGLWRRAKANSAVEIDSAIKYKLGLPMGMLELQDTLGGGSIDTQFHVMEYFGETMGKSYGPAPILAKLFKEKNWGKKTGKGYYDWSGGKTNELPMNAGVEFDPIRVLAMPSTKPPSSSRWMPQPKKKLISRCPGPQLSARHPAHGR